MSSKMLSKELGRVWVDYIRGKNVRNALFLCVALAQSLEQELDVYRRRGCCDDGASGTCAGHVLRTARSIEGSNNVIHADFNGRENDNG